MDDEDTSVLDECRQVLDWPVGDLPESTHQRRDLLRIVVVFVSVETRQLVDRIEIRRVEKLPEMHDANVQFGDDAMKLRVLAELVAMTTRTIEGQALDIGWARDDRFDLSIEDYLVMANHKTAFYSGGVPLAVGAIIGKGTEEQIETLRRFGQATGLAFQIQDDILNLVGTKESTKKDFRSDVAEGKRTLVAIHALRDAPRRERLLEVLSSRASDPAVLDEAVGIMQEAGSIDHARVYAHDLVIGAKAELQKALPKTKARDLLCSMADFFIRRNS